MIIACEAGLRLRAGCDEKEWIVSRNCRVKEFSSGTVSSESLRVESPEKGVLRIRFSPAETFAKNQPLLAPGLSCSEVPVVRGRPVRAGGLTLKVKGGYVGVQDGSGRELIKGVLWAENGRIGLRQNMPAKSRYYGFGEKGGKLDKRNARMTMWNTDFYGDGMRREGNPESTFVDPMYSSIPFFIEMEEGTGRAHGVFLNTGARCFFDLGMDSGDVFGLAVEAEELDLFVIEGPGLKDVIRRYTDLTGRHRMPPLWALGFHQCRWSYETRKEAEGIVRDMRRHKVPCDAIWLDIDHMDDFRIFTFDRKRFPAPRRMIDNFAREGMRTVAIVDPGFKHDRKWDIFREGVKGGHFFKDGGEIYRGKVWPGDTVFPDFRKAATREWFGRLVSEFADRHGLAGIWFDMNEPSDQRDQRNNPVHRAFGNLYPHLELQGAAEEWEKRHPGRRKFFLTRAACAGSQRYTAIWTGDNCSRWDHLEMSIGMSCTLGLSGMAFVGSDVGGFAGCADGELLARWTQYGAFTPFFRNHSGKETRMQEPWAFGPDVLKICREYTRLRYQLLPYIYSAFRQAVETGLPVQRPMVLEFPDDIRFVNEARQYMFGDHFLVAPVFVRGAGRKTVTLPRGRWVNFHTDEVLEGAQVMVVKAPLGEMPLYVRAGAPVPMWKAAASTVWIDRSLLRVECFPGGAAQTSLYEDDGETTDCESGRFTRIALSHEDGSGRRRFIRGRTEGMPVQNTRKLEILFRGCNRKPKSVKLICGGRAGDAKWTYSASRRTVTVQVPDCDEGFQVLLN